MRKIIAAASAASLYLSAALPAFAQGRVKICPEGGTFDILCKGFGDTQGVVNSIINLLLIVAILIALVYLIIGGVKWVVSGGDKTAVEGARNQVVAALVGMVIALLAFFIIRVVLGLFGLADQNNLFTLPKIFG